MLAYLLKHLPIKLALAVFSTITVLNFIFTKIKETTMDEDRKERVLFVDLYYIVEMKFVVAKLIYDAV